ncbi:GvpL/GvpF family gas vesicle protein [Actinomadura madurae]|nr:GvpL/GvpF family gas vesicle protein [Actinomadura madurae]
MARGLDPAALGDAAGVAGAPVRGVRAAGLTALVSTVRLEEYGEAALRANLEDLAWLEATARAHHDVVDRAAHAAPTAPVRIATIYRDDARVAEVLAAQGERFAEVLDLVSGRSEWGVKAYAAPESLRGEGPAQDSGGGVAPSAEPPHRPPPPPHHRPHRAGRHRVRRHRVRRGRVRRHRVRRGRVRRGRDRLPAAPAAGTAPPRRGGTPDRRAGRRRPRRARRPRRRLAAPPAAGPPPVRPPGTQILNVAYLLDDEQVEGFLAVTRTAAERLEGIEVEVTGPWPPYSFIDTSGPGAATPPREAGQA